MNISSSRTRSVLFAILFISRSSRCSFLLFAGGSSRQQICSASCTRFRATGEGRSAKRIKIVPVVSFYFRTHSTQHRTDGEKYRELEKLLVGAKMKFVIFFSCSLCKSEKRAIHKTFPSNECTYLASCKRDAVTWRTGYAPRV